MAADGSVLRATTDPPERADCVAKATASWPFKKGDGEAKFKVVIR